MVTVPLDCLLCTCCSAIGVGTRLEASLARGGCARHSDITPVCKPIVSEDNVQSSALTGRDLLQTRRTIGVPLAEPLTQPSCQSVVPLDDKTPNRSGGRMNSTSVQLSPTEATGTNMCAEGNLPIRGGGRT